MVPLVEGAGMGWRPSLLTILLTGLVVVTGGVAQDMPEVTFHLPTPQGWRTETLPFPLDFAPELEFEGVEELRLSPGMFDETSEDFWSRAFVWWVPEATHFSTERLENDLETYFLGLTGGVAAARQLDPGKPDFDVRLEPVDVTTPAGREWTGTVRTFDIFTTQQPIRLNVRIDIQGCTEKGHLAVFFQLSPQPFRNAIWAVLGDVRQDFRCEG
jgi:hypothetical protein